MPGSPARRRLPCTANQARPRSWRSTTRRLARLSKRLPTVYAPALSRLPSPLISILGISCAWLPPRVPISAASWRASPKTERGAFPFAKMECQDVDQLLAEKKATPHAAKGLLKALRSVAKVAIKLAMITEDPTKGIRVATKATEYGFRMWEEDEIAQFEAHWSIGSRERLAFGLLLYTGQRRGDVIQMGRQHVKKNILTVRQSKTGTVVRLPILPELQSILAASKTGHLTFLTTPSGEAFTAGGFTNWFGKTVRAAGLPLGLSAHGLRKAMCRRLAEHDCTVHQIQAISGHVSLSEVERYTKGVEQERLANAAMSRICKPIGPDLQTDTQAIENK